MKTLTAILISLLLMCTSCALALSGTGYPAYEGADLPDNALGASFGDERVLLKFDPTREYSNRADGSLQLCFFAYNANEDSLLELYLMLPEELTADSAEPLDFATLYLYETTKDGETLFFASQMAGIPVPENASLRITLDKAESGADAISASGTLEANLVVYQNDLPTGEVLTLTDAQFDFTLPLNAGEKQPDASANPISPAFTLPPDYAKI